MTDVRDLIERLRHMADNHHAIKDSAAMSKAADELQSQSERIDELEGALERIAKHDVGLQGLIEDGKDTPDNVANYYAAQVERRRKIARASLTKEGK